MADMMPGLYCTGTRLSGIKKMKKTSPLPDSVLGLRVFASVMHSPPHSWEKSGKKGHISVSGEDILRSVTYCITDVVTASGVAQSARKIFLSLRIAH